VAGSARPGATTTSPPIYLITTGTLAHVRALAPTSDWAVRRFRPNLVFDEGPEGEPFAEDALLGSRLRGASGLELTARWRPGLTTHSSRAGDEFARFVSFHRMTVIERRKAMR
jgi:uncharacterized protein YcbX